MKKIEKSLLAICLMATAIISIATSKTSDSAPVTSTRYGEASNCASAVTNVSITVSSEGKITEPANTSFLSFGLPVVDLVIGTANVSGVSNNIQRSCSYSLDTTSGRMHIYTCRDNGAFACMVTFTEI